MSSCNPKAPPPPSLWQQRRHQTPVSWAASWVRTQSREGKKGAFSAGAARPAGQRKACALAEHFILSCRGPEPTNPATRVASSRPVGRAPCSSVPNQGRGGRGTLH